MKKIKYLLTMVLVALVAFAVQSCGSDDDNNNNKYSLKVSAKVADKGGLTNEESEAIIMSAGNKSIVADYPSEQDAITVVERIAQTMTEELIINKDEFKNAVFTYTLELTKVSNGAQVITYYVEFNKNTARYYNNKNNN